MGPLSWFVTFFAICLGWTFFRANSLTQAFTMLHATGNLASYAGYTLPGSLFLLSLHSGDRLLRNDWKPAKAHSKHSQKLTVPLELRFALYAAAVYVGVLHAAQTQAFIYFQF